MFLVSTRHFIYIKSKREKEKAVGLILKDGICFLYQQYILYTSHLLSHNAYHQVWIGLWTVLDCTDHCCQTRGDGMKGYDQDKMNNRCVSGESGQPKWRWPCSQKAILEGGRIHLSWDWNTKKGGFCSQNHSHSSRLQYTSCNQSVLWRKDD